MAVGGLDAYLFLLGSTDRDGDGHLVVRLVEPCMDYGTGLVPAVVVRLILSLRGEARIADLQPVVLRQAGHVWDPDVPEAVVGFFLGTIVVVVVADT